MTAFDTLGVSMWVESLDNSAVSTLGGEPCVVTGRVVDPSGALVAGATADVCYDVQRPDEMGVGDLRGAVLLGRAPSPAPWRDVVLPGATGGVGAPA